MAQLELFSDSHDSRCNADEAPEGYYAIPKAQAVLETRGRNICEACDWRPQCNDPETDHLAYGHRCMSYEVVAFSDGKVHRRQDGCSVVFKKRSEQ